MRSWARRKPNSPGRAPPAKYATATAAAMKPASNTIEPTISVAGVVDPSAPEPIPNTIVVRISATMKPARSATGAAHSFQGGDVLRVGAHRGRGYGPRSDSMIGASSCRPAILRTPAGD